MDEHPIIFSGEMVRAILDGRKTMTRRVIKPQPIEPWKDGCQKFDWLAVPDESGNWWWSSNQGPVEFIGKCPYGRPGDRLWVREVWAWRSINKWLYRATDCHLSGKNSKWQSPLYMPRRASRILLEIDEIRIERVQDIAEEDAKSEGVRPSICPPYNDIAHKAAFMNLWDSLNSPRGFSWENNPWVWVVKFHQI